MDVNAFLTMLGVAVGPVVTIVALVEIVKWFVADKIKAAVKNPRAVDLIWVGAVFILAAGAAVALNLIQHDNPLMLVLQIPAYAVGAIGTYVGGRIVIPGLKPTDQPPAGSV